MQTIEEFPIFELMLNIIYFVEETRWPAFQSRRWQNEEGDWGQGGHARTGQVGHARGFQV